MENSVILDPMHPIRFLLLIILSFVTYNSRAAVEHNLFTKLAVFPIADADFESSEEAWWQMRESLTRDQRYLVASRRFMINRGVFQPRKTLKPADIVILGKILDAEALVTSFLVDRKLNLFVYNAEDGTTLWKAELQLHPAIPIQEQIVKASQKMIQDFLNAIPYQSYQVHDEHKSNLYIDDGESIIANIAKSSVVDVKPGDAVEWITVQADSSQPFFNQNVSISVVAEAKVIAIKDSSIEVQIFKLKSKDILKDGALIRFPKELYKSQNLVAGGQSANLAPEYLNQDLKEANSLQKGHNATTTALAFFGNIALMILIAF